MYLWRRLTTPQWWVEHESNLRDRVGPKLAVIERTNRKRLQIEVASQSLQKLRALTREFGGHIEKLPRDWLRRFSRQRKTKPLKIGRALLVSRSGALQSADYGKTAAGKPPLLVIPVAAAFGTGEHATTAMSLELLERLTQKWDPGWSIVDLGTGSGILALAASRLGARRAIGIDNDPTAIATAKENARLNKIEHVNFQLADVRRWKHSNKIDIVTANLFSELLIAILPNLKRCDWLILSGILRDQEREVARALKRNKIDILQVRHRGKWVALLARQLRRS